MKYLYEFSIILFITLLGELIYKIIPLPIPASIYGLLIMLISLKTKVIKLDKVKTTGNFLLEIMPIMFIPAAVGLLTAWTQLKVILIPLGTITLLTTIVVMAVTGRTAEFIIKRNAGDN